MSDFDDLQHGDPLSAGLGQRAQAICHRLLCSQPTLSDLPELQEDPELAEEVRRRLHTCGLELHAARGWNRWVVTGLPELRDEVEHELNQPQLAALAYLYLHLEVAPAPHEDERPRLRVHDFCARFGAPRGWNIDYVRRAIIGPLERADYVRTVTPQGSRREAYLIAGPAMILLDRRRMLRRLERFLDQQEAGEEAEAALRQEVDAT